MRNIRPKQTISKVENALKAMGFLLRKVDISSPVYGRIELKYKKLSNKLERMKREEVNKNDGK